MTAEPIPPPTPKRLTAREALIAEALHDCARLLDRADQALAKGEEVLAHIEQARAQLEAQVAAMADHRQQVDAATERYSKALISLDKSARERYTATVVEQTRTALNSVLGELRAASALEQDRLHQAAAAAIAVAAQAHANAAFERARGLEAPIRSDGSRAAPLPRPFYAWFGTPAGLAVSLGVSVSALCLLALALTGRAPWA